MVSIKHLSKNKHFLLEKKRERGGNSKTRGAKKKQKKRKKTKTRKKYDEIEKQVLKSSKTTNSKILPSQIMGGERENFWYFFCTFLGFFTKKIKG